MDKPDLLIQPKLGSIRFTEFDRAEEIIKIGYEETRKRNGKIGHPREKGKIEREK